MKILVDAALFQLRPANADDVRVCFQVLAEMTGLAILRDVDLIVLDRGGLPNLSRVETCRFPSYKAENSVADGDLLERMGRSVRADVFVSTALTMIPSLPNVQLLFGEGGEALLPGRSRVREQAECEIALAFSAAVVFASPLIEDAIHLLFPRRQFRGTSSQDNRASDGGPTMGMAEAAIDAALRTATTAKNTERHSKFLALRRMQAAFEL